VGTVIISLGSGTGGAGTYTLSVSQSKPTDTAVAVDGLTAGNIYQGQALSVGGVAKGSIVTQLMKGVGAYRMNRLQPASAAVSATTTSSSSSITVSSLTTGQLKVGDAVVATGIPLGTTVTSIPENGGLGVYVLSAAATLTGTNVVVYASSTGGKVYPLLSGDFSDLKLNFKQNNTASFMDQSSNVLVQVTQKMFLYTG
jgi:hypothetical protein